MLHVFQHSEPVKQVHQFAFVNYDQETVVS